jgi:hypothetical protein
MNLIGLKIYKKSILKERNNTLQEYACRVLHCLQNNAIYKRIFEDIIMA